MSQTTFEPEDREYSLGPIGLLNRVQYGHRTFQDEKMAVAEYRRCAVELTPDEASKTSSKKEQKINNRENKDLNFDAAPAAEPVLPASEKAPMPEENQPEDDGGKDNRDSGGDDSGNASARVICTQLVRHGLMPPEMVRLDAAHSRLFLSPCTVRGYHAWAVPYVRLMRRLPLAVRVIEPLARWRAEEIAWRLGKRAKGSLPGKVVRFILEPACWLIGLFARPSDYSSLYIIKGDSK